VESAKAKQGVAQAVFNATAVLQADREADVTAKATGVVQSIRAEAGDEVSAGQVLAVLESDEQRLRLQQARANYEKTRNNWLRSKKLLAKGLANAESVSNLKFETQVLKAALDQAQLAFDNTRIKSPIDGTLVKRFIKAGSLVQNGEKAFKVVDFNSLQAIVNVPEMQLQKIHPGLPARLRFDALDGAEVAATVLRVSPAIDEKTGTFTATLAIPDAPVPLRPGLFARVAIIYDQHPAAVLIDKNAIIREDQSTYVWLVDGDGVKKQIIRTGYEMPDSIEVVAGLQAGDEVVTTGKNNLSEDASIHVIQYD
jgi:RND family efflux transporter MFP subunit